MGDLLSVGYGTAGVSTFPEKWGKLALEDNGYGELLPTLVSQNFNQITTIRAGHIVGLNVRITDPFDAATIARVQVTINGAPMTLQADLTPGPTTFTVTQLPGIDTYGPEDEIGVYLLLNGFSASVPVNMEVWVDVTQATVGDTTSNLTVEVNPDYIEQFLFIDDVTVVPGDDSGATATITPPESPDPGMIGQLKLALNNTGDSIGININDSVLALTLPSVGDPSTFIVEWRVQVPDGPPPGGGGDFKIQLGCDATPDPDSSLQGIRFACSGDTFGNGNWWAVANDGSDTTVDTGVEVSTGIVKLTIVMTKDDAKFYIDEVLVATITAGLPLGTSVLVGAKYEGSFAYTGYILLDYVWFQSTKYNIGLPTPSPSGGGGGGISNHRTWFYALDGAGSVDLNTDLLFIPTFDLVLGKRYIFQVWANVYTLSVDVPGEPVIFDASVRQDTGKAFVNVAYARGQVQPASNDSVYVNVASQGTFIGDGASHSYAVVLGATNSSGVWNMIATYSAVGFTITEVDNLT